MSHIKQKGLFCLCLTDKNLNPSMNTSSSTGQSGRTCLEAAPLTGLTCFIEAFMYLVIFETHINSYCIITCLKY